MNPSTIDADVENLIAAARVARDANQIEAPASKHEPPTRPKVLDHLPARFAWAVRGSPLLKQRIKIVKNADAAIDRIVGAKWVTIFGAQTGAGKTSLFNAAFREWIARNPDRANWCWYDNAQIMALGVQWAALGKVPEMVDRALHKRHYALDALGTETPHHTNPFAAILVHRKEANLTTWVATHLGETEFVTRYGAAAFRAVTEGALVIGEVGK